MSATSARAPLLALPGFLPDAVGFAGRFTAALLLAYATAFFIQLDSASSAGLCVAIVTQPSAGMAMSKALYRVLGTVVGGVAGVAVVALWPQDRAMLLVAFTVWLGACTFVASLLRDFRSYGAVLSGYTVGIVALGGIDAPAGALLTALNRVAAILIGVVAVAVVNGLSTSDRSFDGLVAGLRAQVTAVGALARGVLAGGEVPDDAACIAIGAKALGMTTEASYAATELPDGRARSAGARSSIAAILGTLAASRALAFAHRNVETGDAAARDIFIAERTNDLSRQRELAEIGMRDLIVGGRAHRKVRLRRHYDLLTAARTTLRTVIAVGCGAVFCIYAGWPGATGLLVQQAAFTALLGMAANPSAAATSMALAIPIPAVLAGVIGYWVLPGVSGFVPFALVVGAAGFVLALMVRLPLLARIAPGLLLYFTLLLAPANTESFDLSGFFNNLVVQAMAVLFMVLAFRLLLPVSRRQRFMRLVIAVQHDLRRTLTRGGTMAQTEVQSLEVDRLAQASAWLGRATPARLAVLHRMYAFCELDIALLRAHAGLRGAAPSDAVTAARASLRRPRPDTLAAAAATLAHVGDPALREAVSGLYGASILLRSQWRALHAYGVLKADDVA